MTTAESTREAQETAAASARIGEDVLDQVAEQTAQEHLQVEPVAVGGEELGLLGQISTGNTVRVWRCDTGEEIIVAVDSGILASMRRSVMSDGSPLFSARPVVVEAVAGYKCRLHPDEPQRELWDRFGLPVCRMQYLGSPYAVTRHMQTKHTKQWEVIQEHENRAREAYYLERMEARDQAQDARDERMAAAFEALTQSTTINRTAPEHKVHNFGKNAAVGTKCLDPECEVVKTDEM